jgi:hypothetical protein
MSSPVVFLTDKCFARGKTAVEAKLSGQSSDSPSRKRKRGETSDDNSISSRSLSKTRYQDKAVTFSPAGLSINWQATCFDEQASSDIELTVGSRGIRHGKKPKCSADYTRLESRLCRAAMISFSRQVDAVVEYDDAHAANLSATESDYQQFKARQGTTLYKRIKRIVFQRGPMAGWLLGGGQFKPLSKGDDREGKQG